MLKTQLHSEQKGQRSRARLALSHLAQKQVGSCHIAQPWDQASSHPYLQHLVLGSALSTLEPKVTRESHTVADISPPFPSLQPVLQLSKSFIDGNSLCPT